MQERLPWDVVETFPSTDVDLIDRWSEAQATEREPGARARAKVGLALALYWAVQLGLEDDFGANLDRRRQLVGEARAEAERCGYAETLAISILGELYALWGPDHLFDRPPLVAELEELGPQLRDEELHQRCVEWSVLQRFDAGDVDGARQLVARFDAMPGVVGVPLRYRRSELWRANLHMMDGQLDRAVAMNTDALSSTVGSAGSPFSFQNAAVTVAIERYLRRGLVDVIESVRSIRASSPRVRSNWDAGLAISLSEVGRHEEAASIFEELSRDDFAAVPRDLNWLVTMHLLGLVALNLGDRDGMVALLDRLGPFADLDATHGCGYASYGPIGRVVGPLVAATGDPGSALGLLDRTIETRGEGPWQALTMLERARVLSTGMGSDDPSDAAGPDRLAAAAADLSEARGWFERFDMGGWAEVAAELDTRIAMVAPARPVVLVPASGSSRSYGLRHRCGSAEVAGVGAMHLVELLAHPGVSYDAVELDAAGGRTHRRSDHQVPTGHQALGDDAGLSDAGASIHEVGDREALAAYRRRLAELTRPGHPACDGERTEVDFLRRTIAAGARPASSSAEEEKARVRVTKAIRRCIDSVTAQAPRLGEHLGEAVSTGRRCMYAPPDGRAWELITVPGGIADPAP